jgi:hypothetical protein
MKHQTIVLKYILFFLIAFLPFTIQSQDTRWNLTNDNAIEWKVKQNESHLDHIEMSGFYTSAIVYYGVEKGVLKQKTKLVFPMLRTIPNDTHASLIHDFDSDTFDKVKVNGKSIIEYPSHFYHKGIIKIKSNTNTGIAVEHHLFPSTDQPVFIDKITLKNTTQNSVKIDLPDINYLHTTDAEKGVTGSYIISAKTSKRGVFSLRKNEVLEYAIIYSARRIHEDEQFVSADYEYKKRVDFVKNTSSALVLESPDEILNNAFSFAKIRAVESIFKTKGGLMHAPGGSRYYAAIWANDQAEYANPFFPFLGNRAGNESAINSFRHFARYINDDYKPIPSSIIAEGLDYWNGAGDRGDMAMIAYGATRFALAYGNRNTAKELWPLIEWCLEFSRRKVNSNGVVVSDSDELEGRFAAGDANLNTSSLYYDALVSAAILGKEIDIDVKQLNTYKTQSENLKIAIEKFFGANLNGFETYRYFEGNDFLRAWIATPLTVNIFNRTKGTVDALFSKYLWTNDGLASQASIKDWKASVKPYIKIHKLQESDNRSIAAINKVFDDKVFNQDQFTKRNFRDSKWRSVQLPGYYETIFKDKEPLDGVYWFRKKFKIQNINSDFTLNIDESIDDSARIFVNGKTIGTSIWNTTANNFTIPKSYLRKGENIVAILAIDRRGPGGITGDISIENNSGVKISLNGKWKYLFYGFTRNYQYFIKATKKSKQILNHQEKLKSIFQDENITTFWDRATLYAFRGAFAAGETKRTMKYLKEYSERRLLGEHVPYPVEAYPEGSQRHLSAESALYCRVITEGLLGIRPTGFKNFSFSPKLPKEWNQIALRNIKAFNSDFDIEIKRKNNQLHIKVFNNKKVYLNSTIKESETVDVTLN